MNLAEKINKNTLRFADGITKLPFDVPQFYKDGGEVDLFKNYPNNQGLAQRLPQAGSNAATQSHDLRFQMDKQGKSYMPKPDPYRVNLGQNAAFTPPTNIKPVGPTLVDSNMAAGIANNAANLYQGPFKSQVMDMFPKPQYKYGGKVDPTESGGYGLIQGEGTGKSDDIDATLNQQDYILPIETVNMVGRQWLDDLVARIMGDEQMEGEGQTPEVEARVSDQEYRIPAQVVEELGVEFFDRLKQLSGVPDLSKTIDGKPAYAYKGLVEDEALKEILKRNVDSYPADPNRFGYQGVPSTKQISPYVERGTNIISQGDVVSPKKIEPLISNRGGVEPYNTQNFTLKGDPYNSNLGVDANKNLSVINSKPTGPEIDPYTGKAITKPSLNFTDIGRSVKNFAKGVVADPTFLGTAAYNINEKLLNNSINKGNALESGSRLAFSLAGNPAKILNDPENNNGNSPLGRVVEYLTPVPELAKAGRFGGQDKSLSKYSSTSSGSEQEKKVFKQPEISLDQNGNKIIKAQDYENNGLRLDSTPQTLHWGYDRFTNSGDVEKDKALQAQFDRDREYRAQRENSVLASTYSEDPGRYGTGVTVASGAFSPNAVNLGSRGEDSIKLAELALRQEQLNQPDIRTYTDESGATRFYDKKQKLATQDDLQKALEGAKSDDENERYKATSFLNQYFPNIYKSYFSR